LRTADRQSPIEHSFKLGPGRDSPWVSVQVRPSPGWRVGFWLAGCRIQSRSARHVFGTAELIGSGILPSEGLAGLVTERAIGGQDPMGSPPTMRSASAVLVTTRMPKAELEESAFGTLARERLAVRGTRNETLGRPPAASHAACLRRANWAPHAVPSARCPATVGVLPSRRLAGENISVTAEVLSDRLLP